MRIDWDQWGLRVVSVSQSDGAHVAITLDDEVLARSVDRLREALVELDHALEALPLEVRKTFRVSVEVIAP